MKKILFEQKKIILLNKQYFVEDETDYVTRLKNQCISLLPEYIK
jgi:hypothetical protein